MTDAVQLILPFEGPRQEVSFPEEIKLRLINEVALILVEMIRSEVKEISDEN